MSRITAQMMSNADNGDEELAFAVFHMSEMLVNLQRQYDNACNEKKREDA
jgi:hypothetical protein